MSQSQKPIINLKDRGIRRFRGILNRYQKSLTPIRISLTLYVDVRCDTDSGEITNSSYQLPVYTNTQFTTKDWNYIFPESNP